MRIYEEIEAIASSLAAVTAAEYSARGNFAAEVAALLMLGISKLAATEDRLFVGDVRLVGAHVVTGGVISMGASATQAGSIHFIHTSSRPGSLLISGPGRAVQRITIPARSLALIPHGVGYTMDGSGTVVLIGTLAHKETKPV